MVALFAWAAVACSGTVMNEDTPGTGGSGGGSGGSFVPTDVPSEPVVNNPPAAGACSNPVRDPGPLVARRLTRWEYASSVKDVLGVDLTEDLASYPRELRTEGFFNTAKDLLPTLDRVSLWNELARKASDKITNLEAFVGKYTSCRDPSAACRKEFITRLGGVLARRPLQDDEVARFLPVFEAVASCGLGFDRGAKAVLQALLQSPQFLYRTERQKGGEGMWRALDGYELASRLSYLAAGTTPDLTLQSAAASGDLLDADRRAKEVRRLLTTPGGKATARRFLADWLTLDELDTVTRARDHFSEWDDSLRPALKEEVLRLADDVLFTQRQPLASLLTTTKTFATPELAKLYGMASKGAGWRAYDLPSSQHRQGILTTPGVLMRSGGSAEADMIARSLFIFRSIMCQDVPRPPDGTITAPPAELAGSGKRALSEYRVADATCGKCHRGFEPLAFAFEPFDGIGVFRAKDEAGRDTRMDGQFPAIGTEPAKPFKDVDEFIALLVQHPETQTCLVKKPLQFALGRALEALDECTIEDLSRALAATDGSYEEFLVALARHPTFAFVRRE